MCFGAHSNRHLLYPADAPVLYGCIVLLWQQEPARGFSSLGMPTAANVGLLGSWGTGTTASRCIGAHLGAVGFHDI